jgi:CheY-like chemotaxis protein
MPTGPRVLLVTSSADEREMYAESFRRRGFCTLLASTAADAFRIAAELPPAAVVTDARLAGTADGLSLARLLKHDPQLCRVPLVLLTAAVLTHDREAAARAGCDLFVAKPCLPDALTGLVIGLIERSGSGVPIRQSA